MPSRRPKHVCVANCAILILPPPDRIPAVLQQPWQLARLALWWLLQHTAQAGALFSGHLSELLMNPIEVHRGLASGPVDV